MASEREILKKLTNITVEELLFLERGYGEDMPEAVLKEHRILLDSQEWLTRRTIELNQKEFPENAVS